MDNGTYLFYSTSGPVTPSMETRVNDTFVVVSFERAVNCDCERCKSHPFRTVVALVDPFSRAVHKFHDHTWLSDTFIAMVSAHHLAVRSLHTRTGDIWEQVVAVTVLGQGTDLSQLWGATSMHQNPGKRCRP